MKLYVVTITEVYTDQGTLEITPYVNSKAFKTFEEAKENMIERYEAAKENVLEYCKNVLEYCMDDDGELELDSDGYTEDGYGQAVMSDKSAKVSAWDDAGMNNVVEIKIEEVEVAE